MSEMFLASLVAVVHPYNLLLVLVGVLAGTLIGALPGLTA